jgi:hypothetical protein
MQSVVARKAEQAGDSTSLALLARVGLIAYGVVHLLIGWLAGQIAWGARGETADSSGALHTLAEQPFGKLLLGLVAVGMVALTLWQASEAVWGYRRLDAAKRRRKQVTSWAQTFIYALLAFGAASIALGSGSTGSTSEKAATSGVMAWPAGQVIVVVLGLLVIGFGATLVIKGAKRSFVDEIDTSQMSSTARSSVLGLGQAGYVAKGIAFGVVGALLAYAALTFDKNEAHGLDGAMQTILVQPFGRFLLTAVALGFAAFGLFAIIQSRYRRM